MEDKKPAVKLLKKYLTHTASAEEIEQVENWYNAYEGKNVTLNQHRKKEISVQMQQKLQQHMQSRSSVSLWRSSSFLRIAAMVLILCSVGLAFLKIAPHKKHLTADIPELTFSTNKDQHKTIRLQDGSEISLSPLSKITYPINFQGTSREVRLVEGEAFFNITHDEKRPFSVNLPGKVYTRVLGTSFTIRALKSSGELNIAVSTGKVVVGNKNQLFGTLIKGQQITYNKYSQSAMISQTPVPDTRIVFDGINLQQAIHRLEYLYTIKIELSPEKLGNLGCTAVFHSKQTPEEILDIICSLHNLQFNRTPDHKSFKIYKK